MFALLAFFLSSPTTPPVYTIPETVIVSSPPAHVHVRAPASAWHCSAPRELVQGSGTVRTCERAKGGAQ